MGAPTFFAKWIPEDDLLLKNAVEAGASLESLAKGAVNFSRRFTVRELEDRWRSLLYDLNTSTEASARIIEIEIGSSACNSSKLNQTCSFKIKDTSSERRNGESLRCHYHSAQKRARNESHNSANGVFLMPTCAHATIDNDSSLHDPFQLQNELTVNKFPSSAPYSENYGHPETHYGSEQHVYPRLVEAESIAPSSNLAFHGGMDVTIDTKHPVGLSGNDCLGGLPGTISTSIKEVIFHDSVKKFDSNLTQKDLPHAIDRNHCSPPGSDIPESRSEFHHLGYSSPPPGLPIWKTIEDVSTPTLQMDGQFVKKGQRMPTMDSIKEIDDEACDDDVILKSKLNEDTPTVALDNSTILLESNFIDFSSSCMSFADDEDLLLIDVDEEDIGDRSCLNGLGSIFLSSPNDTHMDNLSIPGEIIASAAFDVPASNTEISLKCETMHEGPLSSSSNLHCSDAPGVSILACSPGASPIPNLSFCVLNTEDQDIPCNDDVIFPVKLFQAFPLSNLRQDVPSTLANDEKATSNNCTMVNERKTSIQQSLPMVSLLHSAADCILESVPSARDLISGASKVSVKDVDDPNSIPQASSSHYSHDLTQKNETLTGSCMPSHPELVSTELGCVDSFPSDSISDQEEPSFDNEEDDDDVPNSSDVEAMILDMDLGPYDQESRLFTMEGVTSKFTIIITWLKFFILSYLHFVLLKNHVLFCAFDGFMVDCSCSSIFLVVSRYQCIDTKKTIIRLEQGVRSYMNRAISSQGAFAVFYGRHLKYFIKNIEVLIGRETEDIKVDIDLAKEGRANKISRRQAIIKMDEEGCFHLVNVGKSSIFVNSKEVSSRKRINLSSCALIEIKDMRFIFEVNEAAVRRRMTSTRSSNHAPKSEFDFVSS